MWIRSQVPWYSRRVESPSPGTPSLTVEVVVFLAVGLRKQCVTPVGSRFLVFASEFTSFNRLRRWCDNPSVFGVTS